MDLAEQRDGAVGKGFDRCGVGDIGDMALGAKALRAETLYREVKRIGFDVGDQDGAALRCKPFGQGQSDAAGSASDHRGFLAEILHRPVLPFVRLPDLAANRALANFISEE